MSVDPGKKEIIHELKVPDKYVEDSFSPESLPLVASYFIVLVLVLSVAWIGVSTAGRLIIPRSIASRPSSTPVPVKPLQDCPNPPPVATKGKPSLAFCSPEYLGNVAGPAGTRIVLIGENFSSLPNKWSLVMRKDTVNIETFTPDMLKHCLADTPKDCWDLKKPSLDGKFNTRSSLFTWQWKDPLPVDAQKKDYFVVAQIGDQLIPSSKSFTLLTSQAPCIGIFHDADNPDAKLDCTKKQNISFQPGDTIKIRGANWLLAWQGQGSQVTYPPNLQIEITARCLPKDSCSKPVLFDYLFPHDPNHNLNQDGTFSVGQTLPQDVTTGDFMVTAWNKTTPISDPTGDQRTVVTNNTLTFGEDGAVTIHIHK